MVRVGLMTLRLSRVRLCRASLARRERPRGRAAEQRDERASPHGALKPRTTPYHILEWEDCASQQDQALDFRFRSMLLKKSRNTFWRFFRKKRSETIFAD
jgi:hypothetical protein